MKLRKKCIVIIICCTLISCLTKKECNFHIPDLSKWDDIKVEYLTSSDNIELAYRQLTPKNPQKAIIFIPGATMYGYYYIPFMEKIYNKNILIRVIDLRGHGDSGGKRGDAPDDDSIINDLKLHINDIQNKYKEIDLFIGGHSMGAGICGRFLEKYGSFDIKGIIYIAPFFHYSQPGMKDAGFVEVDILKLISGEDHEITYTYYPMGNDPKLVRYYTKIMGKATMVEDYNKFKKENNIYSLLAIGKNDELFEWNKIFNDFNNNSKMIKVAIENETHLGIIYNSIEFIINWINQ